MKVKKKQKIMVNVSPAILASALASLTRTELASGGDWF